MTPLEPNSAAVGVTQEYTFLEVLQVMLYVGDTQSDFEKLFLWI